jgi:hypothetical protein
MCNKAAQKKSRGHHPTLPGTPPNIHLTQEHIAAQKDIGLRKFCQGLLVVRHQLTPKGAALKE